MIRMSVTELARNLSSVFNLVEQGAVVQVYRGKKNIVRLMPESDAAPNGDALARAFTNNPSAAGAKLDELAAEVSAIKAMERELAAQSTWVDPWQE
ncbi:MAG: hypothetical protein RL605_485 [Actinomycetota bacterium]